MEGKSAGGLVADGLSSLPAEVRQNCGLLCLEGKPENSASFVRKLVKEVQRELRDERGDEAEAALSDEGRMHQKLVDRLQQRLGDKHQDKKRGDMVQLVLTVVAGARHGQDYSTPAACRALRYDRVVAMVDADQHGTHILSLIITTLDSLFPSLLRRCKEPSDSPFTAVRRGDAHRHPFMYRFLTPLYLLVLRQGEEGLPSPLSFCTEEEYGEWRAHTDERVQARSGQGQGVSPRFWCARAGQRGERRRNGKAQEQKQREAS